MALNEQTEMAFGNAPIRRDPVSGNEVPPGALPSEVRDDIPARLSEGEYVVPADVLQYYGIKFFEDLRNRAKAELSGLEANGRMGGEPVGDNIDFPFPVEELNVYEDDTPVAASMGGMVQGYQEGGITDAVRPGTSISSIKTFINDAGQRLFIRFVDGTAIPPVPPGYTEEGVATTTTTPTAPPPGSGQQGRDESDEELQKGEPEIFARDLEKMNAAQLAQYAAEISKTPIYNKISNSKIGIIIGSKRQEKKVISYLEEKAAATSTDPSMKSFYQDLLDGIEDGKRDELIALANNLANNDPNLSKKVLVSGSTITADKKTKGNGNVLGLAGTKYAPTNTLSGKINLSVKNALAGLTTEDSSGTTDGSSATSVLLPGALSGKYDSANEFAFDPPPTETPVAPTSPDYSEDVLNQPYPETPTAPTSPDYSEDVLNQPYPEEDKTDLTSLNYDPAFQYMGGSGMSLEERLKDAVPDTPFNFYDLETNQARNMASILKLAEVNPGKVNEILATVGSAVTAQDDDAVKAGKVPNVYTEQLRNSLYNTYEDPRTYEQLIKGGPVSATPSTVLPGYFAGDSGSDPRITTANIGTPMPADEFVTDTDTMVNNQIAANNRRLAEIEARQAQIELDRETRRKEQQEQNDRDGDRDSSNAGDFTGGQTDRGSGATAGGYGGTGRGRSGYNKGGLASRKTKKKREK